MLTMRPLTALDIEAMESLESMSAAEGFRFLTRFLAELHTERVALDAPKSFFLGAFSDETLIAVGGVTVDPYTNDTATGRLRHLYVTPNRRRQQIGRRLVASIEQRARGVYTAVRLRTDNTSAALFYESIGYARTTEANATHRRALAAKPFAEPERVMPPHRIHILGASGSGTTTLGRSVANSLTCTHLDTDDVYWRPSDPPFLQKRAVDDRLLELGAALDAAISWTLSGSLSGWGDPLIARFTHVVFITLEPTLRLARLRERERARYGDARIALGGELCESHRAFMTWAEAYETAGVEQRSRQLHEQWLSRLPSHIRVLRVDGAHDVDTLTERVLAFTAR